MSINAVSAFVAQRPAPASSPPPARPPDDSQTNAVVAAAAVAKHLNAVASAAAGRLDVTV